MIGNSWWTDVIRRGEEPRLCPPRVVVSISGEPPPQEGSIEWTGSSGKSFDSSDPPTGTTYIGRCVGKQLFISDVDEKKKKVEALVRITTPASDTEPERVIGTFPSRPIKVISKPSKKRQSAKNLECKCFGINSEQCCSLWSDASMYKSRIDTLAVPPLTISDRFYEISLRVWFWILLQRLGWRSSHGPRPTFSLRYPFFYSPHC
jgi:hypothetical protein